MRHKKLTEEQAALARTDGGAADPVTEEAKAEPAAPVIPPPLPAAKEVPEKPLEQAPPPPPEAVTRGVVLPAVPFEVFRVSCGIKWDQMAGFKSHAKRLKLGPRTIPEWREAFADFMKRPVG